MSRSCPICCSEVVTVADILLSVSRPWRTAMENLARCGEVVSQISRRLRIGRIIFRAEVRRTSRNSSRVRLKVVCDNKLLQLCACLLNFPSL